ncbi:MAG: hypothetical protein ACRC6U_06040, partial [Fusobacteriaceae bacterium]
MLNKIKSIFKNEELEKEAEDLRVKHDLLKRSFLQKDNMYNELLKNNIEISNKKLDLELNLSREKDRNEKLKNEYFDKIVTEMNLTKKLKNEIELLTEKLASKSAQLNNLEADYISKLRIEETKLSLEKQEKNKLIEELSKNLEFEKIIVAEKSLEIEKTEKILVEGVIKTQIKTCDFISKWACYEKYLENKNDLIDLLKTFDTNDFKEMYLEGKKRG